MFFWLSTWATLILAVTGIALIFKNRLPIATACLMSTVHGFIAIIFVAMIVAHAYLGSIANPGTFRAIVDGKVSLDWARKHHSEWYRRITRDEEAEPDETPADGE
jgi:formate dehydrogenase subunit gamma